MSEKTSTSNHNSGNKNSNSSILNTPSTSLSSIANGNTHSTQNSPPPNNNVCKYVSVVENALALREDDISIYKCSVCNNFLSVPPIFHIDQAGKQYQCGRCQNIERSTTNYPRSFVYENVARFLLFPCIYKNCSQKIPWGIVEEHETQCLKRTITCPMYQQSCHDTVEVTKLEAHFKEKHMTNIHEEKFLHLIRAFGKNSVYLWKAGKLLFLVYILLENELSVNVFSLYKVTENYTYNVKIEGNCRFSCLFENQTVKMFDERKLCFKCLNHECSLKWHKYSQTNKATKNEHFTKLINKSTILQILGDTEFIKITLNFTAEIELSQFFLNFYRSSQNNDKALQDRIDCPICNEYMVPPIYMCYIGHTICNVCKSQLENCPTCKMHIGKARNFTLEKLCESVQLPCQYKNGGCKFSGNVELLKQHESNECIYARQTSLKRKRTLEDN